MKINALHAGLGGWVLVVVVTAWGSRALAQEDGLTLMHYVREGETSGLAVEEDVAVFTNGSYLDVYGVENLDAPEHLGRLALDFVPGKLWMEGSLVLIGIEENFATVGVQLVDVADPTQPALRGRIEGREIADLDVEGGYVFVAATASSDGPDGFAIIDLRDPDEPVEIFWSEGGEYYSVECGTDRVYLRGEDGVSVVDASVPAAPIFLAVIHGGQFGVGAWTAITHHDGMLYLAHFEGILAVDVTEPANPQERGRLVFSNTWFKDLAVSGERLYVVDWPYMVVIDVADPTQMTVVAEHANDVLIRSTVVFDGTLMFSGGGAVSLTVVDLLDPTVLQERARIASGGSMGAPQLDGTRIYASRATSEGQVLVIYDAANPSWTVEVGRIVDPVPDPFSDPFAFAVRENLLFLACRGGFEVFDVSDPADPEPLGTCSGCGPLWGAEVVKVVGTSVVLRHVDGLVAIDVSDPSAPTFAGTFPLGDNDQFIDVVGSVLILNEEGDTVLVDAADPAAMVEIARFPNTFFFQAAGEPPYIYALVFPGTLRLVVFDLSDPDNVIIAEDLPESGTVDGLVMAGNALYRPVWDGSEASLRYLDVSERTHPVLVEAYPLLARASGAGTGDRGLVVVSTREVGFYVFQVSRIVSAEPGAPEAQLRLHNAPNPFRRATTLRYRLPEATQVHLAVFDLLGRRVAVLADGVQAAGSHTVALRGDGLPSGVYVVRLQAGTQQATVRVARFE